MLVCDARPMSSPARLPTTNRVMAVLVLNARMGEQQRPAQVTGGLLGRLRPGRAA